jgi:hypothetical protein
MVTISNVDLTLDQLLAAIHQLDEASRIQVARALAETKMDADLASLIDQLAKSPPANDISDRDVDAEVRAVRRGVG